MNDAELIMKIQDAVSRQCQSRGYAAPVDVLMDIGVLSKRNYEDWRRGRVDFLERVCQINLKKLSFIQRQIRICAQKNGLKPSVAVYRQWGTTGKKVPLRFSKSGKPNIETWYATHFIDQKRMAELRAQQGKSPGTERTRAKESTERDRAMPPEHETS